MAAISSAVMSISIHPPRVGWDSICLPLPPRSGYFNPPTPCGVGHLIDPEPEISDTFQSTHPVWGGTAEMQQYQLEMEHFNPPTPCGVGRRRQTKPGTERGFQSTHPVWGGTWCKFNGCVSLSISIHPPRVGWDYVHKVYLRSQQISIHPPRVGWDGICAGCPRLRLISIHPPRVGWDATGRTDVGTIY